MFVSFAFARFRLRSWLGFLNPGKGTVRVRCLEEASLFPSSNDIPPGVARARERVGWNETPVELESLGLSSQVVLEKVNVSAVAVKSETSPRKPCFRATVS